MKSLLIGFFTSFLVISLIWFISGFLDYGNDIYNKHLDLYETFQILDLDSLDVNFEELLDYITGDMTIINITLPDWLEWFNNFITITLVPFIFLFKLLIFIVNLLNIIITFIFSPVFV